jgi:hypothetical protein
VSERDPEMMQRIRALYDKWNCSTPDCDERTCAELIGDICASEVRRALVEELERLSMSLSPKFELGARLMIERRLRELRDSDDEEWTRNKVAAALDEGGQPKPYSELRGETEQGPGNPPSAGDTAQTAAKDAGSTPAPGATLRERAELLMVLIPEPTFRKWAVDNAIALANNEADRAAQKMEAEMDEELHAVRMEAQAAMRHVQYCMRSFEPKHEHKEAGCAYLLSLWFDDIEWTVKTPEAKP